jgi:hypothetical protein
VAATVRGVGGEMRPEERWLVVVLALAGIVVLLFIVVGFLYPFFFDGP